MMGMERLTNPYNLRKASILDIPYLYGLILQGSSEGSFSDRHFFRNGYLKLLAMLFKLLLKPVRSVDAASETHAVMLLEFNGEQIGFIHYSKHSYADKNACMHIEHCAIATPYRNLGHGTWLTHWAIGMAMQDSATLTACCTKYARVMQHIFKKVRFKRTSIGYGLEMYTLAYPPSVIQESPHAEHNSTLAG